MKKIFLLISIVVLLLVVGVRGVNAFPSSIQAAPSTTRLSLNNSLQVITVGEDDDSNYPAFYYKTITDGGGIICLSGLNIVRPKAEDGACNLIEWDNPKQSYAVAYILDFIRNSGTANDQEKYYYQELIVFDYLGLLDPNSDAYRGKSYETQVSNIINNVKNANRIIAGTGKTWNEILTAAAQTANNTDTSAASLTVNGNRTANLTFTLNEDGYYYSNPVTITANTTVPSITPSNSKFKVDKSGNQYTFKIKATDIEPGKTETFNVIASVSKSYKKASRYDCGQNSIGWNIQDVSTIATEQVKTSANIEITGSVKRNYSSISKKSAVDGSELPGAKLEILNSEEESISCMLEDENGELKSVEKCEWISTDKETFVYGLGAGKYYIKETIAPEGYELSEDMVSFEIVDGEVASAEMVDELEVPVPDTLSARSSLLIAIAMFDIALGIGIITYVKKNKATK